MGLDKEEEEEENTVSIKLSRKKYMCSNIQEDVMKISMDDINTIAWAERLIEIELQFFNKFIRHFIDKATEIKTLESETGYSLVFDPPSTTGKLVVRLVCSDSQKATNDEDLPAIKNRFQVLLSIF